MAKLKDRIYEIMEDNVDKDGNPMSYQAFADRVNLIEVENSAKLTKSFVADIMNGTRQPKAQTIVRIAKAFNISTDYLLGVTDIKASANDDINIAAKTTGLSTKDIENLSKIAHHEKSPKYVYIALDHLLSEYVDDLDDENGYYDLIDETNILPLLGKFWELLDHKEDDDIIDYEETISFRGLNLTLSANTFIRDIIHNIESLLSGKAKGLRKLHDELHLLQSMIDNYRRDLKDNKIISLEEEINVDALDLITTFISSHHEKVIERLNFSGVPELEQRVKEFQKKGGRRNGKNKGKN